ncbi:MAG TPA: VOC family protein [Frankiaceae bacterium]|nr:VOC family protein [Frankiaceae bacterium]
MANGVQVTFDCSDPGKLAAFWASALGYVIQPPPEGFESWPAFLTSIGVPESAWNSRSACVDPDGRGPRLFFQQVPEGKAAKNRVHLDVDVGRDRVAAEVERLVGEGATRVGEHDEMGSQWVVMADPEGNEFCLQ